MSARVEDIMRVTAQVFASDPFAMRTASKQRHDARPRQVAMYLTRRETGRSLPEIGREFGGRDHTTVLHGIRRVESLLRADAGFAAKVESARRLIQMTRRERGFNLLSLAEWLALARHMRVPHVPARFIADIAVEDLRRFEDGDVERGKRLRTFFDSVYRQKAEGAIERWDHCAPSDLKARMARGAAPVSVLTLDDPRAYELLDDLPTGQETMTAWSRPWTEARRVNGYPVEYRVFVSRGEIVGVSSYYPQRPLLRTSKIEYEIGLACIYAKAMIAAMPLPIVNCQLEAAGLPADHASCSLDFLASETRGILFLEGGPPHTPHWGAHPCCFEGYAIKGLALARGLPPEPWAFSPPLPAQPCRGGDTSAGDLPRVRQASGHFS